MSLQIGQGDIARPRRDAVEKLNLDVEIDFHLVTNVYTCGGKRLLALQYYPRNRLFDAELFDKVGQADMVTRLALKYIG